MGTQEGQTENPSSVFKEVTDIVEVGTQEGQTENPSSVFKEVTDIVEVGTQEGQTENPSSVFKEVTDIVEVGIRSIITSITGINATSIYCRHTRESAHSASLKKVPWMSYMYVHGMEIVLLLCLFYCLLLSRIYSTHMCAK